MQEKILIVDDEPSIVELIKFNLEKEGFSTVTARDGQEALRVFAASKPDLVLLDIMLPVLDGWEVCRTLRKTAATPIIMLTAKGQEADKVTGLELGADDYITKPFSPRELIARVRAVLRRATTPVEDVESGVLRVGDLIIDADRHTVTLAGKTLSLTPKEFELLRLLAHNKGKVLSRDLLLERVWGYDYHGETRTVDVHVRRLRQKMDDNSNDPKYIHTVHGVGYKLEDPVRE